MHVPRIAHHLSSGSPASRSEWSIPGDGDVIDTAEWVRLPRGKIKTRRINPRLVKSLPAVISCGLC